MRQGSDLADILGIQRAVLGPGTGEAPDDAGESPSTDAPASRAVDIDPDGDEARRLIEYGLAELDGSAVIMIDPRVAEIVSRTSDQLLYVRALLRIYEATMGAVDDLAVGFVRALEESVAARFGKDVGKDYVPKPGEMGELGQLVQDYRELWSTVVSDRLDKSLHQQMASARSEYAAGVLPSGLWGSKAAEPD
ncbi:MAG: hypothetical protein QOD39_2221 [Mycobacterium sp.]|nr:hypothetical protein [Mycobacterium sp.]